MRGESRLRGELSNGWQRATRVANDKDAEPGRGFTSMNCGSSVGGGGIAFDAWKGVSKRAGSQSARMSTIHQAVGHVAVQAAWRSAQVLVNRAKAQGRAVACFEAFHYPGSRVLRSIQPGSL